MIAAQIDQCARVSSATRIRIETADEQLVGDRVEHAAERRLLLPGARKITIEVVRDAGRDENQEGAPIAPVAGEIERKADQRGGGDSAIGQDIGKVERPQFQRGAARIRPLGPSYSHLGIPRRLRQSPPARHLHRDRRLHGV